MTSPSRLLAPIRGGFCLPRGGAGGMLILLVAVLACTAGLRAGHLRAHVNPFVGTAGHGHTYPGAAAPFGMVQLSPDTRVEGWDACGGYHYSDSTILGFSHTHLSGTGIADYGDILLLPFTGEWDPHRPPPSFRHADETASPGYYRVKLSDGIVAELTASTRTGVLRYTFPKDSKPGIVLDLHHGLGPDRVIESGFRVSGKYEVTGFRRSSGWAQDERVYFCAKFSQPIRSLVTVVNDSLGTDSSAATGTNLKLVMRFPSAVRPVTVTVGISFTDIDGARRNLMKEAPKPDFDRVRRGTERLWDKELDKIEIEGGSPAQTATFATALYHAMLTPNVASDVDGRYRGMNGAVWQPKKSTMYSVFSLWDTFRAEHPLLTIIDRARTNDFVNTLLTKYDESGTLPVWELASNETWTMIGYHAVPVIVDAYMKGIRGYDAGTALGASLHSAMLDHFGLASYRTFGYIPGEKESESVSKTLEYAYDDWCIAQLASALGMKDTAALFLKRSQSYRNLFDDSTKLMRPKINGGWVSPFDPYAVTQHYTEANAWQYSFFVPQDVGGLIELHGGNGPFIAKLDSLFEGTSALAGRDQADITGLIGQYAQGNEPSHHVAYLYHYAGAPWKSQRVARQIMDSLYGPGPAGLCGNDDCGQMSAWYVMSAIGLYQVTPGLPVYCIGSPLFDKVTIHLENGKKFALIARGNSGKNPIVGSARLDGHPYSKSFIDHGSIMNGSTLEVAMSDRPGSSWGISGDDIPRTPHIDPIAAVPYVASGSRSFTDKDTVVLACPTPGGSIFFTVSPPTPKYASGLFIHSGRIILESSSRVTAYSQLDGRQSGGMMQADFVKFSPIGTISLKTAYAPQYSGGGTNALIDGIRGTTDFRLGAWQGYEGTDLDAVIDLGTVKSISAVTLGCLQDNNSWIFFPRSVTFSFSNDGVSWSRPVVVPNDVPPESMELQIRDFGGPVGEVRSRYVRVQGANLGVCPPWHKGAGGKAWLFVDEIRVTTEGIEQGQSKE